jgi:hypothetical protein
MKKKLSILVAALVATTSIVATSANAAPLAVTVGGVANVTTTSAPASVAVPSTNVIDAGHSVAIAATADANTVVTFTTSGKVKLVSALNTADAPKTSTSGASSASVTSTGVASTVYAYTTSTETGTVTVVNGSYSTIIYIKGTAGPAAKVIATIPGSVAVNTSPSISVSATDVFGNAVAGETIAVTLVGAVFSDNTVTKSLTTSAVTSAVGVTPITVLGTATAVLSTVSAGNVTVVATDVSMADTAVGLPAAVKTALITFPVSDLDAQIAGLKAQLAIEIAGRSADKAAADKALADAKIASDKVLADAKSASDLAAALATTKQAAADLTSATYKAQYNALAKKWNKKHPTAKVALIK